MAEPTPYFVQHALSRAQASLRCASSLVARATTLGELVRHNHVNTPAWLRPLLARETNALQRDAEHRAGTIVNDVLEKVATLTGAEQQHAIGRARQDFQALRGHFPRLFSQANRALHRLQQDYRPEASRDASLRERG